jgi:hypothetical protein
MLNLAAADGAAAGARPALSHANATLVARAANVRLRSNRINIGSRAYRWPVRTRLAALS